jgi:mono/diheme cytochrome c family protein
MRAATHGASEPVPRRHESPTALAARARILAFALRIAATCAVVLCAAAVISAQGEGNRTTARSVWDGVYSRAQVERAAPIYREQCASCHGTQMRGAPGSPALAGAEFLVWWEGRTAAELFDVIRRTMPPGSAGRLTGQQYVDLIAAMFQASGFPPGARDLPMERTALEGVRMHRQKPQ